MVEWLSPASWSGGLVPGSGDVAVFANTVAAGTLAGIDFGGTTNNGAANQSVGTIQLSGPSNRIIGASTGADGVLTLQGVGGGLLVNSGSGSLSIVKHVGGAGGALSLNLASAGVINITASGDINIGAAITGTNGLTKTGGGSGALVLSGQNSFTGGAVLNGGSVVLDYTAENNDKLDAGSSLTLAGTKLTVTPNSTADTVQTVHSTMLNAGASTITVTKNPAGNNTTLNLNTITVSSGGTLNIIYGGNGSGAAVVTVDNANTNGILGGWATLNGRDWAANATDAADGAVLALAAYTNDAFAVGNNTDITITGAGPGNPAATTNSLRFNQLGARTLALGNQAKTITSGGILITANVGAFATIINGSNLRAASGTDLVFHQYNTAGDVTVNAVITNQASGGLVKTGPGTLILAGANTFTGGVFVNQGVLSVATVADSGTASNLGAGAAIALGDGSHVGTLLYTGGVNATNRSVVVGAVGAVVNVSTAAGALTLNGVVSGTGFLTKLGVGGLTLAGENTFTGNVSVLGGVLTLDYAAFNTDKVSSASTLTLGGGGVAVTGNGSADTVQTVAATVLNGGANSFAVTKNAAEHNATLNLNTLTRNSGATVNFAYAGSGNGVAAVTVDNTNTNGILGGWATFNGTDWAVNSTNAADGRVVALATYYTTTTGGNTAANYATKNVDVTSSPTMGAAIAPVSIRFNAVAANTLTLTGNNNVSSGGILVTANVGNNPSTITGGNLRGPASGDLIISQFNTANVLTIASTINNNTSTRVIKTGPGALILAGTNNFTGGLIVNQGTVTTNSALASNAANAILIKTGATLVYNFDSNNGAIPLNPVTIEAGGILTNNGQQYNTLGDVTLSGGTIAALNGRNSNYQSWGFRGTVTVNGDVTSTISAVSGNTSGIQLGHGGTGNAATTVDTTIFDVADGAATVDLLISAVIRNSRNFDNTGQQPSNLVKNGSGTLHSSGNNAFTGTVTVNAGTLRFTGTNTFAGATVNGGILQAGGALFNDVTNVITVNNGGTFAASANNVFGTYVTTLASSIVINAGGTVTNTGSFFSALGAVTLNGGTLTSVGGNSVSQPSWALKGDVTVSGEVTSTISSTGTNGGISLGTALVTGTTFNVGNGAAATDLLISAVLSDGWNTAGTAAQASSFTKTGAGLVLLTAANIYTGHTNINEGTLSLASTGSIAGSTLIQIAPGALLDVSAKTGGLALGPLQTLAGGRTSAPGTDVLGSVVSSGTLNAGGDGAAATFTLDGDLTLQDGGTIRFDFGTSGTVGGGVNDLISVTGALNLSGITTILAPSSLPVSGVTYTLISAGSLASGSAANFAFASSTSRQTYTFDTSTTPGAVLLTASGSAADLIWTGAVDGVWNVNSTANWSGAADQKFFNLDNVTFNDSSSTGTVVIPVNVQPLSLTVNNSLAGTAYTFTGDGDIIGITDLVKTGDGALTISTINSFTGAVEIQQGTVIVDSMSNAGVPGVLGAGSLISLGSASTSGTLRYTSSIFGGTNKSLALLAGGGTIDVSDGAGVLAISGAVTGSGGLLKTGLGVLTLASSLNSYSGTTTVTQGTLRAGAPGALGSTDGGTIIQNGATLDVNAFNLGAETITVEGTGVGGAGGIINGSATAQNSALRHVTLAGDTTFGGTGNWGLVGTGTAGTSSLDLAGFTLTKIGTNTITLTSTSVTDGDIIINQGTLGVSLGAVIAGTGTITVNTGGTFASGQSGLANTVTRSIVLVGGTLANTQNSTVAAPITLAAGTTSAINNPAANYNVTGPISGAGNLAITLSGNNSTTTFSGGITSTGDLTVNTIGTAATATFSGGISGAANVTLTHSGSGTTTLNTVAGNSITGSLVSNGANLNIAGTGNTGAFTIGGGLTLGGTGGVLRFDLTDNGVTGNDQILIGGVLSLGGTTTININALNASLRTDSGSYTLIGGGTSIAAGDASNLVLTGIIANTRQTFVLDTTTTPGSVLLNVGGSIGHLTWAGSGSWDVNSSQNWNGGSEKFFNWDAVIFDDTAASGAVSLTTTVTPTQVTINNSAAGTAYSISGSGGVIAGAGGLLKLGDGILTLGTANTFTGGSVISAGEVRVQNASAPGAGTIILGDGTTGSSNIALYLDTARTSFARTITVSSSGTGTVTLGSRSTVAGTGDTNNFLSIVLQRDVIFDSNAADRTDYRNITGTGSITVTGTGRSIIAGTNSFSGNITVNTSGAGYLQIGVNNANNANLIPDTASVTVISGARLAVSVAGESIDALNGSGTVNAAGVNATLSVGASGGNGSFSGVLANGTNTLAFAKVGSGTQILSGSNTYTGGTVVSAGTLLINNTSGSGTGAGGVTVSSGATLGGIGTLAPDLSGAAITINGVLAPGTPLSNNGVGTLTLAPASGNVIFGATSSLSFELLTNGSHGYNVTYQPDGTIATVTGTYVDGGNDRLIFDGGNIDNQFDFSGLVAENFKVTFASGYTPAANDTFDLLDWANITGSGTLNNEISAINGLSVSHLSLPDLSSGLAWDTSLFLSHGIIGVYAVVVPEPSRVLLSFAGVAALLMRRRRAGAAFNA